MNERLVLFLDSGVGGISYCRCLAGMSGLKIVHIADNANFPYGKKSKSRLTQILEDLLGKAINLFSPDLVVIACNTASVSALSVLRKKFAGTDFVGTVPAVKPAILGSAAAHIAVLGTERTIADSYIRELGAEVKAETGKDAKITGIPAPRLIHFIEHSFLSAPPREREEAVLPYITAARTAGADSLVLGCTHFLFLAEEFEKLSAPDIKTYDSLKGVCRRAEKLLNASGGTARARRVGIESNLLLLTGGAGAAGDSEDAEKWEHFAALFSAEVKNLSDFL